jgi:hypothetical protein
MEPIRDLPDRLGVNSLAASEEPLQNDMIFAKPFFFFFLLLEISLSLASAELDPEPAVAELLDADWPWWISFTCTGGGRGWLLAAA